MTKKILTITLNPSVDISYQLAALKIDTVNRCDKVDKTAGGKGLNVSKVIHLLGGELIATGFLGGLIGELIKKDLTRYGISHHFCETTQESRNCIAMLHDGKQTEILESGPTLTSVDEENFLNGFDRLLYEADVVTISGSLPVGIQKNFYHQILKRCGQQNIPVLCDTSGEALKHVLEGQPKPFLIKPNEEELAMIVGRGVDFQNSARLKEVLKNSLFQGIEWIVVSLGKDGAFVKFQDAFYKVDIPAIQVVSPVGSGDATVAGLAYGIQQQKNPEDIMRIAMACGMLNSLEEKTGWLDPTRISEFVEAIKVRNI